MKGVKKIVSQPCYTTLKQFLRHFFVFITKCKSDTANILREDGCGYVDGGKEVQSPDRRQGSGVCGMLLTRERSSTKHQMSPRAPPLSQLADNVHECVDGCEHVRFPLDLHKHILPVALNGVTVHWPSSLWYLIFHHLNVQECFQPRAGTFYLKCSIKKCPVSLIPLLFSWKCTNSGKERQFMFIEWSS